MKRNSHAIAGVIAFICVLTFVASTIYAQLFGSAESIASVKGNIFKATFVLVFALVFAGGTGVSLLGKRQDILALTKQKRGPIGFMTSLLVLLPSSYFLSSWAAAGNFGALYYSVQALELFGSTVVIAMVGMNIRDGMALTGRMAAKSSAQSDNSPSIDQRDGGPLVAMSVSNLTGENGEPLPTKPVMALCRCGQSKNKPFCDGSHNDIGFDTSISEDRTKDEVLTYKGKDITVHYNRLLCSHAAECGKRQKAAFDSSRKPWIMPDNATADQVKEVIEVCPSGALRFSVEESDPVQADDGSVGITLEKNGPYRVSGVPLTEPRQAEGAHLEKYVLCRCGASKNKPYWDGSHFDIDWKSSN